MNDIILIKIGMYLLVSSIAWIALYFGLKHMITQIKFYKRSLPTKGFISGSEVRGTLRHRAVHPQFIFYVKEHKYLVTDSISCWFKPKKGKMVDIRFLPHMPDVAHIYGFRFWADIFWSLVLPLILLTAISIAFINH